MSWRRTVVRLANGGLKRLLSPEQRLGLADLIASAVTGEGNADRASNGEFKVFSKFLAAARAAGRPVVVFDVGANVGDWVCKCGELPTGSAAYAFEPVPATFAALSRRLRERPPPYQVFSEEAALSDRDGQSPIFVTAAPHGELNSLYQRNPEIADFRDGGVVQLIRGDTFCDVHHIEGINFLKIDTEGHEMAVLNGFGSMLQRGRIEVIQFEYGGTWLNARVQLQDAFQLLQPLGYQIGQIRPAGVKLCKRYDPSADNFRYTNYLAFQPSWSSALVEE